MSTAFSNALAGLNSNSTAIDVVSGNLANLNTYGYKDTTVSFQDLVEQSAGTSNGQALFGGSTVAQTAQSFNQGSIQTTSQPYDAAIQGNGFFVIQTAAGQQEFTRDGNFKVDSSGDLLTQSGAFVQGWNAQGGVLNSTGAISNIKLPSNGLQTPAATQNFTVSANLNANATVGSTDGTFSSPISVVDGQGNSHTLTITYTETAPNNWNYSITIPSADLATPTGTGATSVVSSGTLVFDGSGNLLTPAASAGPIKISITGLADAASDLSVNWNLYNSSGVSTLTQYNTASTNLGSTQDGIPSAQLTGMSIGTGGQVLAAYSNGASVAVAQLAVGAILNPDSMQDLGQNAFGVTSATAIPSIGTAGTGTRGQITGGALEASTVDIATEFTNLLTYERGYQANSKVITTEDEIIQSTLALKQ